MKKHLRIAIIILTVFMISSGCKKDNGGSSAANTASITDKTWWGMFTYAGDTTEYYSAHFNADGSLTWNQSLAEYAGKWTLNSNHLAMDIGPGSIAITADISNGSKLVNIHTNNTTVVNSGQLLSAPSQQPLDGTVWKGV